MTQFLDGHDKSGDVIRDADMSTFVAEVMEASKEVPILVDFWAPWCGPCKQLTPMIEKVVREAMGAVRLVKVNIDNNQELAAQLRIQSVPTVMAFINGQPVDGFQGALPESQLKAFVDKIVGLSGASGNNQDDEIVEMGLSALENNDFETAIHVLSRVAQDNPTHVGALSGLVHANLGLGKLVDAKAILDIIPLDKANDPAALGARAAYELAIQSQDAGDVGELQAKVESNPDDLEARYELAKALSAHNQREDAAMNLLEIIRRDREWNDEAARKQLVKLFEAAGPTDPFTVSTRRQLSSILFS